MRDREKRPEFKNVALDETYKMRGRFSIPSLFVAEKCHFFDLRLDEESILIHFHDRVKKGQYVS